VGGGGWGGGGWVIHAVVHSLGALDGVGFTARVWSLGGWQGDKYVGIRMLGT